MTPERWQRLKQVIESALDKDAAGRGAYLAEACGDDAELRAEAESFVAAHEEDPSFMEAPAWERPVVLPEDRGLRAALEPGRSIGSYQIVRLIASGGMGAVYLAVRADDAYHKQVAIKVIRTDPYSDSRHRQELLSRFRTERQTLANLEHPNIARLLDGGTTDDGLPYLVMEYIEGLPIDRFCDERRLSTTARLELFRTICHAVNYAHQSLVIHRDLKPGNILVTTDGVPKLLDFGLAKILDSDSSSLAATLTQTGRQPMTPAYASPEQIRGQPVTTSTDIYSLGVILFELLTGHPPYRGRAMHEIARRICEEEPLRPSTAVTLTESVASTDGGQPTLRTPEAISRLRDDRPERLRRRLSGDVDMIVLKALRKEPEHRYPSVELLAEDIRRHLDGEPVLARKGTLGYRTTKFIRRHKVGVVAAALIVLSLAGGLAGTFWQLQEARRQTRVMKQAVGHWRQLFRPNLTTDSLASDAGLGWVRRNKTKNIDLDAFITAGIESLPHIDDDPLTEAAMREQMGRICDDLRRFDDARRLHEQALTIRRRDLGTDDPTTLESMANVGFALMMSGKWQEARPVLAEAADVGARVWGPSDRNTLAAMMNLGVAESNLGQIDKAEPLFRKVLAEYRAQIGEEKEPTLRVMNLLGKLLADRGEFAEGRALLEQTIEISKRFEQRGPEHPATLEAVNNLAGLIYRQNRLAEAADLFREVFDGCRRALADDDPLTLKAGNNYAHCLIKLNRPHEAEPILDFVVSEAQTVLPQDDFDAALFRGNYGDCLTKLGRCPDAEKHVSASYEILRAKVGPDHPATKKAIQRMAEYHEKCGSPDEARSFRAMLETTPGTALK